MAQSVTATAEGASEPILADFGTSMIQIRNSGEWTTESVALEMSPTGEEGSWDPAEWVIGGQVTEIVATKNLSAILPSGIYYRMNVTDYADSPITLRVYPVRLQV